MQFISGLPSVYTSTSFLILRYSFFAGSITKNGLSVDSKIFFTVFVFPLPVIPQIKVCLFKSLSLKPKGTFFNARSYSHTYPNILSSGLIS